MRLTNANQSLSLAYPRPDALNDAPGPVGPLLSTLPGLICWLLFASAAMPHELPVLSRLTALVGVSAANATVLVAWAVAVVASLAATIYYGRRRQAWYTTLCVAFHLTSLMFSLLLAVGLALLLLA